MGKNQNELRKRKKVNGQKIAGNGTGINSEKKPDEEKSQEKLENVAVNDEESVPNGKTSNRLLKGEEKAVEEVPSRDNNQKSVSGIFERLGSLLRETKIDWIREIFKTNCPNFAKLESSKSRRDYFSKELLLFLGVFAILGVVTRIYKVEVPDHVW